MGSAPAGQNRRNSAHKQGHFQVEGQNLVKGGGGQKSCWDMITLIFSCFQKVMVDSFFTLFHDCAVERAFTSHSHDVCLSYFEGL